MDSGTWIKQLLEERFIKASDLERLSRSIAETKGNSDYYVSHGTLADIAGGSVPSIHKIFSLAVCLKLPYEQLLLVFGIDPKEPAAYGVAGESPRTEPQAVGPPAAGFCLQLLVYKQIDANKTTPLDSEPGQVATPRPTAHQGPNPPPVWYGFIWRYG